MKSILFLSLSLLSFPIFSQVIENGGFEEWETTTGPNDEPVDWSSIQTGEPSSIANFASQVLFQSSDAYTGDYCIYLKNVYIAIADQVANGLATNGIVHLDFDPDLADVHSDTSDPKWNTECTTRPDSLVGYFKYIPVDDDITTVQALLHTGDIGKIPDTDSTGWIGMATFTSLNEVTDGWIRFSAPFEYFAEGDPEYILLNISGGNGINAVAGSKAWYDDIELVYNPVGIDEDLANDLLSVYSRDHSIIVNLKKFGAGEKFDLSIYSISGQLLIQDNIISGSSKNWKVDKSGMYICTLESKDGLILTKKVVVK